MPKLPFARDGKYKKVWRRYELRSQLMGQQSKPSPSEEEQEGSKSPARAVKKLRLKRGESGESAPIWEAEKPAFAATRWEWRKSVLPSMQQDILGADCISTNHGPYREKAIPHE